MLPFERPGRRHLPRRGSRNTRSRSDDLEFTENVNSLMVAPNEAALDCGRRLDAPEGTLLEGPYRRFGQV